MSRIFPGGTTGGSLLVVPTASGGIGVSEPAGSGLLSPVHAMGVDVAFQIHGEPATYTPPGGSAVAITVIAKRPDQVVGWTDTRINTKTTIFKVRVSELPAPVEEGLIVYRSTSYYLSGAPRREDNLRLTWTLETRPA